MQRRQDHGALLTAGVERLSRVPTRLDQPRARAAGGGAAGDVPAPLAVHHAFARFTVGIRRCTDLHRRFSTLSNSTLHPPNAGHAEFHRPFRAGGRPLCLRHSPASAAPRALLRSSPAFAGERRSLYSRTLARCCAAPATHGALPAVEVRKSLARSHASRAPRSSCRSRRCHRWRTGAARGPWRFGQNHRQEPTKHGTSPSIFNAV